VSLATAKRYLSDAEKRLGEILQAEMAAIVAAYRDDDSE
jgi:hypothetical protein